MIENRDNFAVNDGASGCGRLVKGDRGCAGLLGRK